MEQNGWLQHILERMQEDIDEIKSDVKRLNNKDAKTHGGVIVICFIFTLLVNAVALFLRV